jgi:hypothetical protein
MEEAKSGQSFDSAPFDSASFDSVIAGHLQLLDRAGIEGVTASDLLRVAGLPEDNDVVVSSLIERLIAALSGSTKLIVNFLRGLINIDEIVKADPSATRGAINRAAVSPEILDKAEAEVNIDKRKWLAYMSLIVHKRTRKRKNRVYCALSILGPAHTLCRGNLASLEHYWEMKKCRPDAVLAKDVRFLAEAIYRGIIAPIMRIAAAKAKHLFPHAFETAMTSLIPRTETFWQRSRRQEAERFERLRLDAQYRHKALQAEKLEIEEYLKKIEVHGKQVRFDKFIAALVERGIVDPSKVDAVIDCARGFGVQ